jgi:tetratricopeptide (TPR) repeat protein
MTHVTNLSYVLFEQSKWASVDSLQSLAAERFPTHPQRNMMPLSVATARRDLDAMDSLLADSAALGRAADVYWRDLAFIRGSQHVIKGRLRDADASVSGLATRLLAAGDRQLAAGVTLLPAIWTAFQRNRPSEARARLEQALQRAEWRNLPATEQPFVTLGELHALLGDADGVRRARQAWEAARPLESRERGDIDWWVGYEAQADGRWSEAAAAYTRAEAELHCSPCGTFISAHAWDRAGRADSAEAFYRRGVERPVTGNDGEDAMYYPLALRRLGELAEQRGDRSTALGYYERFVDLWRNADPDLQPQVAAARQRIAALSAEPRPRP